MAKVRCDECSGSGFITYPVGDGYWEEDNCNVCRGEGTIEEVDDFDV